MNQRDTPRTSLLGPARPLLSIGIDLDPLPLYHRIHGLPEPSPALRHLILQRALPRLLDLLARCQLPATLFVVAADLTADPAHPGLLREAGRQGHELANHSDTHPYDLIRRPPAEIQAELQRAHDRIGELAGQAPVGFRAPGYFLSPPLLAKVQALAYRYDSSIFPAPAYFLAKAGVMAAMRLFGRRSRAILGHLGLAFAPLDPYHPDPLRPWRRGPSELLELPISVSPWLRLPVIGTSLVSAPPALATRLARSLQARPHLNLQLHGIEFLDAQLDGLDPALVARQPDLRVPLARKLAILEAVFRQLQEGRQACTLAQAALALRPASLTPETTPR